jgi:hypothetical protein
MFQLHDKTRRRICLAGFCLLCIAPTLGAAAWCISRHLPWIAQNEAKSLGRQLGLEVHIAGLENIRPGVVLYDGFELADPETNQCLLRCRKLEVQWKTIADPQGGNKSTLDLTAIQPEIEMAKLQDLGWLLQRAMQGQTSIPGVSIHVAATELTLRAGPNSQTLTDVDGRLNYPTGGVEAVALFHLAGVETSNPVKIRMVRDRRTIPPISGFELDTAGGNLPCDLLAPGLPGLGSLGSRSRFCGCIGAIQDPNEHAAGNWSGEVTGQLLGIDLGQLVSDRFPHKLSGTADVTIKIAKFQHGRLNAATGSVVGGPGVIGRSLLQAAVKHMQFSTGADLDLLRDQVPYNRLALELFMDDRGLWIEGRCPSAQSGVIMTNERLCLLAAPAPQFQPATALIKTLVPESTVQVPATNQTDWLVAHLSMPQAVTPQTREAALPPPTVRLRKE